MSDLASAGSAASFEFLHPSSISLPTKEHSQPCRSSHSHHRDTSRGSSRRTVSASSSSEYWHENKENLHHSSSSLSFHRSRRPPSMSQEDLMPFDLSKNRQIVHPDSEGGTTTTSGESPDLGIGSDCHLSSLERGVPSTGGRTLRTLAPHSTNQQSQFARTSTNSVLCSEPSKLNLVFYFYKLY